MVMLLNIFTAVIVLSMWVIGALVLLRNYKLRLNWSFAVFSFVVGAWMIANYIGANFKTHQYSQFFSHGDFFLGPLLAGSFVYFVYRLIYHNVPTQKNTIYEFAIIFVSLALSFSTLTNWVVTISYNQGSLSLKYGSGFNIYATFLGLMVLFGLIQLILGYRRAKSDEKAQLAYILIGLLAASITIVVSNLIIPFITNSKTINLYSGDLSYLGIALLVGISSYTIVKHKLFDIRLVIVRSLGYLITLVAVALLLIVPVLLITTHLLGSNLAASAIAILVFSNLLVAIAFQPLRNIFNRIANKLFYRGYYEPQVILDKLSNLLVGSVDLNYITEGSKKIITEALKPSSIKYVLYAAHKSLYRDAVESLASLKDTLIVTDELIEERNRRLRKFLQEQNVSIVLRLRTDKNDLGFIFIGNKEAGSLYNGIDKIFLRIAADEIAISLQNAIRFKEIESFNQTLQEKIEVATRQLTKANARLKMLDSNKDDFISMASHQLRTPLTSVKGYVSMVLEGDVGKITDQQNKMLSQAFDSSQRMVYLISDLLNISRLQTGKFVIERTDCDLSEIITEEIGLLEDISRARNLKMYYKKPKDFPILNIDEIKTRQVIMNFLDNAIYYTPAGGKITIELEEKGSKIELKVIDTGIGVPASVAHHLFTKFYRADNAKKARPDGTGLGLFMAKKVIIAQGGSIIFSTKENKGSTFGFSLPKTMKS
ncbi:MAG: ATP-binding protein [bacterium]